LFGRCICCVLACSHSWREISTLPNGRFRFTLHNHVRMIQFFFPSKFC
jgi:hypothetical protein